jgi:hypothetical protein
MPAQGIRPSQFITTYGPGAIIETTDGPALIPSIRTSGLFQMAGVRGRVPISQFEIVEPRITPRLLSSMLPRPIDRGVLVYRIPSNAELGLAENEVGYRTFAFPLWSHCERHQVIYRVTAGHGVGCPQCGNLSLRELLSRARQDAVRFVLACRNGHLDEVPWRDLISEHRTTACPGRCYSWTGAGGGLKNVELTCLDCGKKTNFGRAYGSSWPCSGRLIEDPTGSTHRCSERAEITQRLATNLRITQLLPILTIPPTDGAIHRMLLSSGLYAATVASPVPISTKAALVEMAQKLEAGGLIGPGVVTEIEAREEATLMRALRDIEEMRRDQASSSLDEAKDHELRELQRAADYGHLGALGEAGYFEVDNSEVKRVTSPSGLQLRVTPVKRLRVVTVQLGYRRLTTDPDGSEIVESSSVADGGRLAFPGVQIFGEGLFIDLTDWSGPFPRIGPIQSSWDDDPARPPQLDWSAYVWWHTLSHRLITALAIDSGYSAASICERVYTRLRTRSDSPSGGILLYTSQPGADGSLGGLTAQATRFGQVLDTALYSLHECSNDPICGDSKFQAGKVNGAACYACALVSETACEGRNRGLDRNLLIETSP